MKKRLYRSRDDQVIAGVVAGIAEYFDHDPTLWRLAVVFLIIVSGIMPGLLVYIIAWIVIPIAPTETESVPETEVVYESR